MANKLPRIALNMIVKNEAHIVKETLDSMCKYIDYWVICDTGSTDGTQDLITNYFKEKNIPGELHQQTWDRPEPFNFGYARSRALKTCEGKAQYAFVMDGDDLIIGDFQLPKKMTADVYHLTIGGNGGTFVYSRDQIFKLDNTWFYRGAIHEVAMRKGGKEKRETLTGDYYLDSRRKGDRTINDPKKPLHDAERCIKNIKGKMTDLDENGDLIEIPNDEGLDIRYMFYAGMSYYDFADFENAIIWFEKRNEQNGSWEENYYSQYKLGCCIANMINSEKKEENEKYDFDDLEKAFLTAYNYLPSRAEAIYELAKFCNENVEISNETKKKAYRYSKLASNVKFPKNQCLFIEAGIHNFLAKEQLAKACYNLGKFMEGLEALNDVLESNNDISLNDNRRLQELRKKCIYGYDSGPNSNENKNVNTDINKKGGARDLLIKYDAAKVSKIKKHLLTNKKNNLIFTMTTCKRFDLFTKTINSFMNCCEDVLLIDRWIVVDDNSSEEDRKKMEKLYPFIQFHWKGSEDKGHPRSMNIIRKYVEKVKYHLHMEDDFLFFVKKNYIKYAIAILDARKDVGQVLFNRNYAEELEEIDSKGGKLCSLKQSTTREGLHPLWEKSYREHVHYPSGTKEYEDYHKEVGWPTHVYWPSYSLRPSVLKTDIYNKIGEFDEQAGHFEMDYANRYTEKGYKSVFYDTISCLHIGRLTKERFDKDKTNAYQLNNENQFVKDDKKTKIDENVSDEFIFYLNLDSIGGDIDHLPNKSIEELKYYCVRDPTCLGFNTLGWIKKEINDEKGFITIGLDDLDEEHGLYIHKSRMEKVKETLPEISGYTFYPNKDSTSGDLFHKSCKTLKEMVTTCENDLKCLGFNTLGYFKKEIQDESQFINLEHYRYEGTGGLYVHNERYNDVQTNDEISEDKDKDEEEDKEEETKFRIKMLCNWCDSKTLVKEWSHMSKDGKGKWNKIQITGENENIDLFVIINKPPENEWFDPARTIIFQMEPWCYGQDQGWGVKTWGPWAKPNPSKFLRVRSHDKFVNNCFWQLKTTYSEFKTLKIEKTKVISSICSSKYFDPGHILRIDFLKFLETKNDPLIQVDIYNTDNNHNFKNYKGPHPPGDKDVGILPYKYYFMPENNAEYNFVTEKMWESLLCECLCFYWGAPNISEIIDPRAFILLDLNDFEKSFQTIRNAILNDEWSKRLKYIKREKRKVLKYHNFFPTLERIIFPEPDSNDKYFCDMNISKINNICFIHSCNLNGDISILQDLLRLITSINRINYVIVVNIGLKVNILSTDKLKIINYSDDPKLFERPTINLIYLFAKHNPNVNILYLHTKGVSYGKPGQNIVDWKNLMLYFLVENHKVCLDLLQEYDAVGCNYLTEPKKHFSGNFWWAKGSYINTLSPITDIIRHSSEFWIVNNDHNKHYCIYNSGINHYKQSYPLIRYERANLNNLLPVPKINDKIKIKCINLERRPDRKAEMKSKFEEAKIDVDFYPAIDGKSLEPTNEIKTMFMGNDFGSRRSFIGCALSHIYLWKELIESNNDAYLIFEDDANLEDNFLYKLYYLLNNKIEDIIYLGHHYWRNRLDEYKNKVDETKFLRLISHDPSSTMGGLFGYIISKEAANKILNFIEKNGVKHGIDYVVFHYANDMNLSLKECIPNIVLSEFVSNETLIDSDIQYNYDSLF